MSQLVLDAISKTYPRSDRAAVHAFDVRVEPGELLALVGESGSGKTTLLRLISGLEHADAGTIELAGKVITGSNRHVSPEERGVGLVFQHHALFPHLTVARNVTFGLRKKSTAAQREILEELLSLVGLPGYGSRFPHELSGGERQRVALARALAPGPGLLLLDEPFSNLDPQWRISIRDETRRILKQRGSTAILVTHHTQDALSVADRIAVLHEGVLQQTGTPHQIYHAPANERVASLFGVCNFIPLPGLSRPDGNEGPYRIGPPAPDSGQGGIWVRPEDLELALAASPPSGSVLLQGTVQTVSFQGDHQDVALRCEAPGGAFFEVRVQHRGCEAVAVGQTWSILPKPRHESLC